MENPKVVLFYKYIHVQDPENLTQEVRSLCQKLNLKGRVIIATEGINATLEGSGKDIKSFCKVLKADPRFSGTDFKISNGTGSAFPKLSVKIRDEIVAADLGKDDVDPMVTTGKYITAKQLHEWFESEKEFYLVDMRNDYEQLSGHFEGSILSNFDQFRDLPQILEKLKSLKDKTILTVCTGGVRCEKASGFLVNHGFKDVYQLYGGIVTYMEEYPGQHFKGVLYVFDNRLVIGFNADPNREIISKCAKCHKPSENYVNCAYDFCHFHYICCQDCYDKIGLPFCKPVCKEKFFTQRFDF